jgi:hypothetical protein
VINAAVSTELEACTTLLGFDITVAVTATGGTCTVQGGAASASCGNAVADDQVCAQHTSSGSQSASVQTIVTAGGQTGVFTSTTIAGLAVCSDIPRQRFRVGESTVVKLSGYCSGVQTWNNGALPSGCVISSGEISCEFDTVGHVVTQLQGCNANGCDNPLVTWEIEGECAEFTHNVIAGSIFSETRRTVCNDQ